MKVYIEKSFHEVNLNQLIKDWVLSHNSQLCSVNGGYLTQGGLTFEDYLALRIKVRGSNIDERNLD